MSHTHKTWLSSTRRRFFFRYFCDIIYRIVSYFISSHIQFSWWLCSEYLCVNALTLQYMPKKTLFTVVFHLWIESSILYRNGWVRKTEKKRLLSKWSYTVGRCDLSDDTQHMVHIHYIIYDIIRNEHRLFAYQVIYSSGRLSHKRIIQIMSIHFLRIFDANLIPILTSNTFQLFQSLFLFIGLFFRMPSILFIVIVAC